MTDNIGKRGKLGMKRPAGEGGEGGVDGEGVISLPSLGAQVQPSSSLTLSHPSLCVLPVVPIWSPVLHK